MRSRRVSTVRVGRVAAALVVAATLLAAATGVGHPWSVAGGGAFMLADYHLIRLLVSRLIRPGASYAWTVVLLSLKFVLVIALIVGVFYQFPVAPMSFAFGASMLMVAAVLDAVWLGDDIDPVGDDATSTV
jgi:hypothetical protein